MPLITYRRRNGAGPDNNPATYVDDEQLDAATVARRNAQEREGRSTPVQRTAAISWRRAAASIASNAGRRSVTPDLGRIEPPGILNLDPGIRGVERPLAKRACGIGDRVLVALARQALGGGKRRPQNRDGRPAPRGIAARPRRWP